MFNIKAFFTGVLIVTAIYLLTFIYTRVEEAIGVDGICTAVFLIFLIFASFLLGNGAITLFGL